MSAPTRFRELAIVRVPGEELCLAGCRRFYPAPNGPSPSRACGRCEATYLALGLLASDELVTLPEAAHAYAVKRSELERWVREGQLVESAPGLFDLDHVAAAIARRPATSQTSTVIGDGRG